MIRSVKLPRQGREAAVRPSSFDEKENTVEIIFSTGARVQRRTWDGEVFQEELDMKPKSIRLERLKNGAPFLKDHNRYSIDSQIGIVEDAKVIDGVGYARVRLSKSPEMKRYVDDIKDGILKNVSVGYRIHKLIEEKNGDGTQRILRAVDWEPEEISCITIPADAASQVRSSDKQDSYEVELTTEGEKEMSGTTTENKAGGDVSTRSAATTEVPAPVVTVNVDEVAQRAVEAERTRVQEVGAAVRAAKLSGEEAKRFLEGKMSADQARKEILDVLEKRDQATNTNATHVEVVAEHDRIEVRSQHIADALANRYEPTIHKITDHAKAFRGISLVEVARMCLEARGVNTRSMRPDDIAKAAMAPVIRGGMLTSSDFTSILENVQNKVLRAAYAQAPKTWEGFVRQTQVNDFKEISSLGLGDAPALEEVGESGEIKRGKMSENKEKYRVKTYGKIVPVSRQAIVNDDLNAFSQITAKLTRAAADLESDLVYALINANPTMADGNALFSVAHGNLAGVNAAIAIGPLGLGRAAMRRQKGMDGAKINVFPKILLVPATQETLADQYVSQITPEAASSSNPFGQGGSTRLAVVAEPRLDDTSTTAWYLAAGKDQIDTIEMAHLTGQEGPYLETKNGFDVDGVEMKVRLDVGVQVVEYRGLYKNAGV